MCSIRKITSASARVYLTHTPSRTSKAEFRVVDKVQRLFNQLDRLCTKPIDSQTSAKPSAEDLNVDFKAWMSCFTQEAIAGIGMSSVPKFLEQSHDFCPSEKLDGTVTPASYSDAICSALTATTHLVWSPKWFSIIRD